MSHNILQTTGKRKLPSVKWTLHYRFADLVAFFELERSIAENVERSLMTPPSGTNDEPCGRRLGQHILVRFRDFYYAYWTVTTAANKGGKHG